MRFFSSKKEKYTGQTLVETVAAVFILAMGISSALGLAVYANSTSTNITKQIIATGLAREGVEAVKSMRDTNWLKQINIDKDCHSFVNPSAASSTPSCPGGEGNFKACCYRNWLSESSCSGTGYQNGYCIDPIGPPTPGHETFLLKSNLTPASNKQWILQPSSGPYNLYLFQSSDWSDPAFVGQYQPTQLPGYSSSEYSRQILLLKDNSTEASQNNSAAPFNEDIGPQLEIVSRVWWTDKKCPLSPIWPGLGKCSIEIRDLLTNWKNY